jgi:hypothetical protein
MNLKNISVLLEDPTEETPVIRIIGSMFIFYFAFAIFMIFLNYSSRASVDQSSGTISAANIVMGGILCVMLSAISTVLNMAVKNFWKIIILIFVAILCGSHILGFCNLIARLAFMPAFFYGVIMSCFGVVLGLILWFAKVKSWK